LWLQLLIPNVSAIFLGNKFIFSFDKTYPR
jgi:hypothetical protein